MANEKVYAKGIRTFKRNEKAPEFILGTLVITVDEFVNWCNGNKQYLTDYNGVRQLKLQVLKGKEDQLTIQVDTYKPKQNDTF